MNTPPLYSKETLGLSDPAFLLYFPLNHTGVSFYLNQLGFCTLTEYIYI